MVQFSRKVDALHSNTGGHQIHYLHILVTLILCGLSFYTGALAGMSVAQTPCEKAIRPEGNDALKPSTNDANIDALVNQRVNAELDILKAELSEENANIDDIVNQRVKAELDILKTELSEEVNKPIASNHPRFDEGVKNFAQGIVRVEKGDFVKKFDYGTPVTMGDDGDAEALLFYGSSKAFPSRAEDAAKAQYDSSDGIALLNATEATANCESLNVITISNSGNHRQCTAIVGNYQNYHVQRWMRDTEGKKTDYSTPLQAVSRGQNDKGSTPFKVPETDDIKNHWEALRKYFNHLDEVVAELKPIAESVAKKNTIIVMTCNMGQSELLMNFVCNARAKSLDISNILVFPTDEVTKELAEGLGLATFYDKRNFENLPEKEAKNYGDRSFVAMMFAKVVCVQLTSMLGYDLLFQDVDVVWYRNPLDYFHDESNPYYNFDMYFQDDGAHSARYAPTSANSGFYYVRNNNKTRYFFTALLYSGDIILRSHSHQQALVQLMAEHSSLFGLRVKVLDRETDGFPGGWNYHSPGQRTYMKKLMEGEITSEIFHMSWTKNKDNKVKFFQQMGQWYVKKECISQSKESILGDNSTLSKSSLTEACCFADAEVICHYRDKPSIIPCKESDPIDKGKASFW